ncbi:MAG: DUF3029 family protein [Acidimicrobiales bacterium]|nr:DUF3029 family protein [Acidimicrobiales bacterium]
MHGQLRCWRSGPSASLAFYTIPTADLDDRSHALLHSQAGLDSDTGFTVGTRVGVGTEPDLYRHLAAVAPNHAHPPSGVSDIVRLDETVVDCLGAEGVRDVRRRSLPEVAVAV